MKKILVALDRTPRANAVLAQAVELASSTHAALVLFHAFLFEPELTLAWPLSDRPLEQQLRREAESYLRDCARTVPADLVTEIRVGSGEPWRAICAAAREANADFLVVGMHAHRRLDRIIGTTTEKIVAHADRPVLVAP